MMVNLKTKLDKHENDNEKRRQSIKEKVKAKLNQSQIIKQALLNTSLCNSSSKKIIFNDDDIDFGKANSNNKSINGSKKSILFGGSESENEDLEIKEKKQFSGKKGFELLNLQSTYGNDERFKIDERFLEDEKEDFISDKTKAQSDKVNTSGEKEEQLKILENVLKTPGVDPERGKKVKKRTYEMIRYDVCNKNHKIYEINTPNDPGKSLSKKKKEAKNILKNEKEELPKFKVSNEKFYEVSNEIKNSLKDNNADSGQFSLLQTYGVINNEKHQDTEECEIENDKDSNDNVDEFMNEKNSERHNEYKQVPVMEDKKLVEETDKGKGTIAKGIWKEPFFFVENDLRFKEGIEFINKKNSAEAIEAAENYFKLRKTLKEILRLVLKKHIHKKDPFKNKIGGMNKKQQSNSNFKKSRKDFNKKNPFKKNPDRKI